MGPNQIKVGGVLITGDYDHWKFVEKIYFVLLQSNSVSETERLIDI